MLDSPLETCYVSRAETKLAFAFDHVEPSLIFSHHVPDNPGCTVGRIVVNDEYIKDLRQIEYGCNYRLDILLLIVSGDDNEAVG